LTKRSEQGDATGQEIQRFAEITTAVLRRLGGEYAAFANELEAQPSIRMFDFKVATIAIAPEPEPSPIEELQPFAFEIATVEVQQTGRWGKSPNLVIYRSPGQAQQFVEDLGNGIFLEMVAIPGGSFVMGSPNGEPNRSPDEGPQHRVIIQPFCLGKYAVTQSQWGAIAALPQINRALDLAPSRFQGENRPVERVSWLAAVECCDRLARQTGRDYRLPSEAEWEYACRAGTTTPSHFGETMTTELANYNGNYTYGAGPQGVYRGETAPVGSFGVANTFGLFDLHGNVWEWCLDHWHNNYQGAPTDGSAWVDETAKADASRVLRGGSWDVIPEVCRSDSRFRIDAVLRVYPFGFRVVCSCPWTM
jgi:formylglycine-generating enzyme required for sulfatase activity